MMGAGPYRFVVSVLLTLAMLCTAIATDFFKIEFFTLLAGGYEVQNGRLLHD
jgi:hypothetical protein